MLAVEFADPTKKITLMGNTWSAVTVSVSLVLGPFPDTCWDAEVDFVTDGNLPFALLGYEGFLNRWAVGFNGALGYFVIEQADAFHERQPAEIKRKLRENWPDLLPKEWS